MVLRPSQMRDVFAAPTRLRGVFGCAVNQTRDRGRITHLDRALELRVEKIAKRAIPGDVLGHEFLVAPLALLIAADEPAAIRRVRFDHPSRRMVLLDVVVSIHAPLLVRTADPINSQLRQNLRHVVQRLSKILDATPNQHMKWPRLVSPRALDDPLGIVVIIRFMICIDVS